METPINKYDVAKSESIDQDIQDLEELQEIVELQEEVKNEARIVELREKLLKNLERTIVILEKRSEDNTSRDEVAENGDNHKDSEPDLAV